MKREEVNMTEAKNQPVYYVVFCVLKYKSFDEAKMKASNEIAAHVKRSKELHEQGKLLMSGAFLDSPDESLSTMAVLASHEAADEYINGDPFYLNGMMKSSQIRKWANIFA